MLQRLQGLEDEYQSVLARLGDPDVQTDPNALRTLGKRMKDLEPIVLKARAHRAVSDDLAAAKELFAETEGDDREMFRGEIEAATQRLTELEDELKVLLLPKDPNDDRNTTIFSSPENFNT